MRNELVADRSSAPGRSESIGKDHQDQEILKSKVLSPLPEVPTMLEALHGDRGRNVPATRIERLVQARQAIRSGLREEKVPIEPATQVTTNIRWTEHHCGPRCETQAHRSPVRHQRRRVALTAPARQREVQTAFDEHFEEEHRPANNPGRNLAQLWLSAIHSCPLCRENVSIDTAGSWGQGSCRRDSWNRRKTHAVTREYCYLAI